MTIDSSLVDIVAGRYDAGVRLGEHLDKDMIAVPISPQIRMALVGSPAYFAARPAPTTPHELTQHNCINLRMQTMGGLYVWEFEKDGHALNVRVDGQLVFNDTRMILKAATEGFGLAFLLDDHVRDLVADGQLVRVLKDWCDPFRATICTIRAADSRPRRSRCWSRPCAIGVLQRPQAERSRAPN